MKIAPLITLLVTDITNIGKLFRTGPDVSETPDNPTNPPKGTRPSTPKDGDANPSTSRLPNCAEHCPISKAGDPATPSADGPGTGGSSAGEGGGAGSGGGTTPTTPEPPGPGDVGPTARFAVNGNGVVEDTMNPLASRFTVDSAGNIVDSQPGLAGGDTPGLQAGTGTPPELTGSPESAALPPGESAAPAESPDAGPKAPSFFQRKIVRGVCSLILACGNIFNGTSVDEAMNPLWHIDGPTTEVTEIEQETRSRLSSLYRNVRFPPIP